MRLRFWIGLTAVIVIAAGSVIAAVVVYSGDRAAFDRRERDLAARAADQAEALAGLSVGQLAGATAFVRADGDLNAHEFGILGRSLLSRDVLNATVFVPRVTAAERAAYERRHGFPIVERAPGGGTRRAAARPVYFPVTYVASRVNAVSILGFDLGTDADRAPSLYRAGLTGRSATTPVIDLRLGGQGINVFRAVYRDGQPLRSIRQRRRALIGYVVGSFRVDDLVSPAIGALPERAEVQLRGRGEAVLGPERRLEGASTSPLRIADRSWLLVVRDPAAPDLSLPLLLAVVGVSLAALLAALILTWSRNERMAQLQREASEDPLTGLKNRRRFGEELEAAMARSRRDGSTGAMLMLDIDHFKLVNDNHGHPAGDQLIREVADVLRGRARESDVLARLGGDEFAVVLNRCDAGEARVAAEGIAAAIRDHVPAQEGVEPVTACVGIAMFGADPRISAASVVSEADTAMYAAKDAGRDGVRVFDHAAVGDEPPVTSGR